MSKTKAIGAGLLGLGGLAAYYAYRRRQRKSEEEGHNMRDVDSSMIRQVGYSPKEETMMIRFNTGSKYKFNDVPKRIHNALMESESKGKFFHDEIRGNHDFEKVSEIRRLKDRLPTKERRSSIAEVLVDLRDLDTPEKWEAYRKKNSTEQDIVTHHMED